MFKYTTHNLLKLEQLLKQAEITLRYEKGNFKSGYCILDNKNVAVVNKFFDTEARINALLDIIRTIQIQVEKLDEKQKHLYNQIVKNNTQKALFELDSLL